MERGVTLTENSLTNYLYHDPCHSPMKQHNPIQVATKLMGRPVQLSDRCCGEAGTLGVARPDISNQLRFRKEEELKLGIRQINSGGEGGYRKAKMLTSCPACQQGLSRYKDTTGLDVSYIVEELVRDQLGSNWRQGFIDKVKQGGIERVLL